MSFVKFIQYTLSGLSPVPIDLFIKGSGNAFSFTQKKSESLRVVFTYKVTDYFIIGRKEVV